MSTYQEFQHALRTTGRYETAAATRPVETLRISPLNSFRYAFTIIGIAVRCAVRHLFRRLDYDVWGRICMRAVTFAEKLGGVMTFEGFEQRAAYDGPVVYVSNHMSTLETFVFPSTLLTFGKIAIVLKKAWPRFR